MTAGAPEASIGNSMLSRLFDGKIAWQVVSALPALWWPEWDAFNERSHASHPLLSSMMIKPLLQCFGTPSVLYATCRDRTRVVAQAILTRSSANRWAIFSPSQAPLSALLTDRSLPLDTLLQSLLRALPGYGLAMDVAARDPVLRGETAQPQRVQNVLLGTTISVSGSEGFDRYWESRSKDLRKNLKRYLNRAAEAGLPAQLRLVTEPADIGPAVDRYGLLESSGWKAQEGTALHPENAQGRFYRLLMESFAAVNSASVFELYLGDQLAASRLVVRGRSMHVILKTTYREDLKQYAPGRVLLYLILQRLLEAERVPVEFYTRANDDLLSWATHKRELFTTTAYRNGAILFAASARRLLKRRWQAAAKSAQAEHISPSNVASRAAAAPRE